MSKGEGTTPQTRKEESMTANTVTTNAVLNTYVPISRAEKLKKFYTPYIEFIIKHMNRDRITVRELGEELLGKEAYHAKYVWPNGEEADFRTAQARTTTGILTQALRKLCKMGVLTRHEEKDKSHLIEIECEDYAFFDKDGHQLPDEVDVTTADGTILHISARFLPNVEERFGKCKKKVYPKIVYYTFNK
jgi:hypothetical protein